MASPSAPLDSLAADKRAAVELVLRRGLSYGELASLLTVPEDTIRERARAGLEALAPDLPPPARAGEIADWLLGQQAPAHAERTRTLVNAEPGTRRWAETVAAPLRELSDDVPELDAELPARRAAGAERRPRPLRDAAPAGGAETAQRRGAAAGRSSAATEAGAAPEPPIPPGDAPAGTGPAGRSSRLGGAILIGLALLVAGGVIAFVLTRGHDEGGDTGYTPPATAHG